MDINLFNSPQESGPKNPDPSPSNSLFMTLELIMLENSMQIISSNNSKNHTKSQLFGKGNCVLHSVSNGIIRRKFVDISITSYIEKDLQKFQHSSNLRNHNSPPQLRIYQYDTIMQYAPNDETTSKLGKDERKKVQNIVGIMLYYD